LHCINEIEALEFNIIVESILKKPEGKANGKSASHSKRNRLPVGLAVSLLIHGLALWFALYTEPMTIKSSGTNTESRLNVSILPPSPSIDTPLSKVPVPETPKLAKAAPAEPRKKTPPISKNTKRKSPQVIENQEAQASKSVPLLPQTDAGKPLPADDLFSQVEAARKRRAEAAQESASSQELAEAPTQIAPKDDNSVAMANIEVACSRCRGSATETRNFCFMAGARINAGMPPG
jgi:type IV secretory pathway VirB10-like protein